MTTITQILDSLGTPPQTTDPANFDPRADTLFGTSLPLLITQQNTLSGQINTVAGEVNANTAIAAAAANFQGTWTSETTVIGQSWLYNDAIYLVLIAGNTSPATSPSNWMMLQRINTAPVKITGSTYTVLASDNYVIFANAGTSTVTLPQASTNVGRKIVVKTFTGAVNSINTNVKPIGSDTAAAAILAATAGKWAELVSDGTYWIVMAAN